MIEKSRGVILATLAAGLLSSCASQAYNEQSAKGHCLGANACKSRGDCATANNQCRGQNACKGQGFLYLSRPDCEAQGGEFVE